MPDYHITIDSETVHGLFARHTGLAKLLEQVLNQVLEAQVSEQLGAERYEHSEEWQGYRNGVHPRTLTTRVGRLTLRVPQVREGQFSPELFACYQRSEQALVLALMEMVVNGVSTRKVTQITEELYGSSISKSTVSSLCARLDPLVTAWNELPLGEQAFPFVLADALVICAPSSRRPTCPRRVSCCTNCCRRTLAWYRRPWPSSRPALMMRAPSWPCPSPIADGCGPPTGWDGASEEVRCRERVIRIFPES